jgi:hypothetical protein
MPVRTLGMLADVLQPARGFAASGLDPLQALLAALANRDQLRLHLAATLDGEADGVGLVASGRRAFQERSATEKARRQIPPAVQAQALKQITGAKQIKDRRGGSKSLL